MSNTYVTLPIQYFPDPTKGRPVFNGSVYVGEPDLDPEVEANRKTVTLRQEDGTEVPIPPASQPLSTGAGGVVLYNGSPVSLLINGNYSLKVLNAQAAQVYYIENAFDGTPVINTDVIKIHDTIADMVADNTVFAGQTIRTNEHTAGYGYAGGNYYLARAVTAGAADNGSLIKSTANPAIEFVAQFGSTVSIFQFGASAANDSVAAFNAAVAYVDSLDGGEIRFEGFVGVLSPCEIATNRIKLTGLSAASENQIVSGLVKLTGFTGSAALILGDGVTSYNGLELQDFMIEGDNKAGTGAIFQKLSTLKVNGFRSERNLGWGIHRDGLFLASFENSSARFNGEAGTDSGGIKDTFVTRESANMTCTNVYANQNYNHQLLWDDAPSSTQRMASYTQIGGIYELPQNDAGALFEARCGDRSQFYGTRFPQESTITAPAIMIGSATSSQAVTDLIFSEAYTQHTSTGSNFAVDFADNISSVVFRNQSHGGTDKFMDASTVTSGRITIIDGTVPIDSYLDPNEVVAGIQPIGSAVGYRAGTAGSQWYVRVRENDVPIWLQMKDSGGSLRSVKIGEGADRNAVTFESCVPRLPPQSTAPTNPVAGMLAISDGSSGGFDGVSGEGLYRRDFANAAWVFVG